MTIRRGEPWGVDAVRPDGLVVTDGDAALAAAVVSDRESPVGVSAGDIHRTVGAPGVRERMQALPFDLIELELDGESMVAVAHVIARRGWWRGSLVAVMNVGHLGKWDVAPRAHPNDGRLDVVEVDAAMTVRERWQASRRIEQGAHVPHPRIAVSTIREQEWSFERPMRVWVDGVDRGEFRRFVARVQPDAFVLFA